MTLALEVRGISKAFPGVQANDHIDFELEKGEIHALLGENGAGKSTLMNILYGLYHPDEGQILLNGEEVKIRESKDAIRMGIGMVHQHFMLIPVFTVAENIMLGMETTRNGLLDRATASRKIKEFAHQFGMEIDPGALVKDLPVGVQQRVEIVKALYRGADILILDEPTAVLTPQEANELFRVMRALAAQGKSIIFITHKLKEVFAVADRITVLRGGKVAGSTTPDKATEAELASMMVGREVLLTVEKKPPRTGDVVLRVENLQVMDERHFMCVDGLCLEVRAGEILGVAGVQGNGQTELVEAITGLRTATGGKIEILNQDTTRYSPREIIERGVAHVPEDRQKHGLVLSYPLVDNLVLSTYYRKPFCRNAFLLDNKAIDANGRKLVVEYDIRTPSEYTQAGNLSGGNQQKVIVAREFSRQSKLVVAAQPTRGLDVGSTEFIHQRLVQQRDAGAAILLISVELDEILSLADRIAVLYKGQIIDTLPAAEATPERLGLLMAGIKKEAAQ
ncbi:MAG: Galactose/methyl galactoside import ATP-binding protein MglA [Chloroflexi bacterium ADurb.Bin180]|nr:MAG: Galactose/methyl galactoside import ATP-binding protein MglA [Chloroflexi bacterium ADurb.Bin180]HNR96148.1 ABC transporter ATP-binding protein [Anaerolineae bacterium]HNT04858.1 ABC transporter ATP-binding protein [Anaerolineae bacterium]